MPRITVKTTDGTELTRVFLAEAFEPGTHKFLYTFFAYIDKDDVIYYGEMKEPKLKTTIEQKLAALKPMPDEEIFPKWPPGAEFLLAPEELSDNDGIFIKRPQVKYYSDYKQDDCLDVMATMFLDELHALDIIAKHPHPNIVRYHGCRVRRGYITGLVLDRYENNLNEHYKAGGSVDKGPFMDALEDAVRHLHSLGLAHNDINPANIMVNDAGMPVLVDFGSCREIGKQMGCSRGTDGWVEDIDNYEISEASHDIFGLEKIRAWLDNPVPLR
jgi:serine/threonine protein kinase